MKTFVTRYSNFFRLEVVSEKKSKVHAYALIFYKYVFNIMEVSRVEIVNVDCTAPQFTAFGRYCVNSSPCYLLSKCSDVAEVELSDDPELNFEFDNVY